MDIKSVIPTAEVEFELDRKDGEDKPVTVKLTVNFVSIEEVGDFIKPGAGFRLSKVVREILIDAVVGWDLTEGGKPLECDEANKRRVLPVLFGMRTKGESENPFELILGRKLLDFAGDDRNFLKN
jgi:hypothetical protein